MNKWLLVIGLGFLPVLALARIGETPEQCEQRYGKPIVPVHKEPSLGAMDDCLFATYQKDNIQFSIWFFKTNAIAIVYSLGQQTNGIEGLLKENGGSHPWTNNFPTGMTDYVTTDGWLFASYQPDKKRLEIHVRKYGWWIERSSERPKAWK